MNLQQLSGAAAASSSFSSLDLVPAKGGNIFSLSANQLSQHMGLSSDQSLVIQNGMKYLSKEADREWFSEFGGNLEALVSVIETRDQISHDVAQVSARVDEAAAILGDLATQRAKINADKEQSEKLFEESRVRSEALLTAARDDCVRDETLVFAGMTNPLGSTIGRLVVKSGQYALPMTATLVALLQRELLQANCATALSGPLSALQCVDTVRAPAIYLPLIGAAIGTVASQKGLEVADRMLKNQKAQEDAQTALAALQAAHELEKQGLIAKTAEVEQQNSDHLSALTQAEEDRKQLNQRDSELSAHLAAIQDKSLNDIVQNQVMILNQAALLERQGVPVDVLGNAAMKSCLSAFAVKVSSQPAFAALLLTGGSSSRPAIAAAAAASE